jgi:hypothetical protein
MPTTLKTTAKFTVSFYTTLSDFVKRIDISQYSPAFPSDKRNRGEWSVVGIVLTAECGALLELY